MFVYFKDKKPLYFSNEKLNSEMKEIPEKMKYPILENDKIIERYAEEYQDYIEGKISKEEFQKKLYEKLKIKYIELFKQSDNIILMKQKHMILNLWNEEKEIEFQIEMEEYKKNVLKYEEIKTLIDNLVIEEIYKYIN